MRIVFLSAAKQCWGAEQSLLALARELSSSLSIDCSLVAFPGELADSFGQLPNVTITLATEPRREHRNAANAQIWRAYLADRRREDCVVIFTYHLIAGAFAFRPLLKARGIKVFLDLHDNLPGQRGQRLLRMLARGADGVIACSRFTASQLNGHPFVVYLHRPVTPTQNLAQDVRPRSRKEPFRVGIVGRIARNKGHPFVVSLRRPVTPTPNLAQDVRPRSRKESFRVGIVGRIARNKGHLMAISAVTQLDDRAILVVRGDGDGSSLITVLK